MSRKSDILIALFLFTGTIGLYFRAFTFGFVNYDDDVYVYENPHVTGGVSFANVKWAFTTGYAANWHPVTWISHMIDAQVFGVKHPGGHHATNAILHSVNVVLLYALVRRFCRQLWLAGLGAAMFAWHPLRVESVVWISERKDLLAGFFWLAATHAYLRYVRNRTAGRYSLVLVLLALGLMSKPMLVTFPFALLLLDFWPLKRFSIEPIQPREVGRLILEKLPMISLVIISSIITFLVQQAGKAVALMEVIPLRLRLENAAVAVMGYLKLFIAPINLSVFYPHPGFFPGGSIEVWKWGSAVSAIVLISAAVVFFIRRWPFLCVGWLFFLGTLVPVIGIVQVGAQAMADRYTYIPMLGIIAVLLCGVARITRWNAQLQPVVAGILGIVLLSQFLLTRHQIEFWKDSRTLMGRAVALDQRNFVAHNNLASALDEQGDKTAAELHYRKALEFNPRFPHAEFNLANLLEGKGDLTEALRHYNRAVKFDPEYGGAYNNYGNLLSRVGRGDDAILVYEQGVKRCPDMALLKHNLATSLAARGDMERAIRLWREALVLDPNYPETHRLLGVSLAMGGNVREGMIHLQRAIQLSPDNPEALNNLAWILATAASPGIRNAEEAEKLAARACQLTKDGNPTYLDTLAAAQAAAGRFELAGKTIAKAMKLAEVSQDQALLSRLRDRKAFIEQHLPMTPEK